MIDLIDIQEKLQDTAAVLAKLRAEMTTRPNSAAQTLEIKSLEKRMAKLESVMRAAAAESRLDVGAKQQEKMVVKGELIGADVSSRTFHFRLDNGSDVQGSSGAVIDQTHSVELPKRYTATILKTTTTLFSTEEEKVGYELLHLTEI